MPISQKPWWDLNTSLFHRRTASPWIANYIRYRNIISSAFSISGRVALELILFLCLQGRRESYPRKRVNPSWKAKNSLGFTSWVTLLFKYLWLLSPFCRGTLAWKWAKDKVTMKILLGTEVQCFHEHYISVVRLWCIINLTMTSILLSLYKIYKD